MSDGTHHVYRSSVTGRFVTQAFAEAHPKTTYRDTVGDRMSHQEEHQWTTSDNTSDTSPSPPSSP